MKFSMSSLRRWSRTIHRELSFFLSGMVLIYAISGLVMNHRDTINPNYTVKRTTFTIDDLKPRAQLDRQEVVALLERSSIGERYTKHYFPEEGRMKVFLKGGSSLEVDLATGQAVYESLRKRPIIGSLTRLHYNPGQWWTWFSDFFAIGLIVLVISGAAMLRGKTGITGRGGIELLAGILLPLLLLFIS